jgi:hypothetical protein
MLTQHLLRHPDGIVIVTTRGANYDRDGRCDVGAKLALSARPLHGTRKPTGSSAPCPRTVPLSSGPFKTTAHAQSMRRFSPALLLRTPTVTGGIVDGNSGLHFLSTTLCTTQTSLNRWFSRVPASATVLRIAAVKKEADIRAREHREHCTANTETENLVTDSVYRTGRR